MRWKNKNGARSPGRAGRPPGVSGSGTAAAQVGHFGHDAIASGHRQGSLTLQTMTAVTGIADSHESDNWSRWTEASLAFPLIRGLLTGLSGVLRGSRSDRFGDGRSQREWDMYALTRDIGLGSHGAILDGLMA